MERHTNSEELKLGTRDVHMQLERMLIPLIQNISTRSQYANLLKLFYTFYAPLEDLLSTVPDLKRFTAGIVLRKADSLKTDIMELKGTTDNLVLCSRLPPCFNLNHAFGILYVLEGSVLGGKAIAGIITKKIPAPPPLPFSFFKHYGDNPDLIWNQFKANLDSMSYLSRPALVSAATATFILLTEWISVNSNLPGYPEERAPENDG